MVVTVGVSIVIAAVLGNGPTHFTFNIDKGPAVHLAFPVLVEDGDYAKLDDVCGTGNGAVVVAFLFGVCPNRHALIHGNGSCIGGPRTVFRNCAIINRGTVGSAGDAHTLFFKIGACFGGEGRCGHRGCGRDRWFAAFSLHEEVEVEVVTTVVEVVGVIWAEVVVAV